ncbi:MAG: hypothetical protein HDT28_05110 [Clostridiales bacterium]|nr:hypothetical protein [Clostridiales bacterium]
MTIKDIAKCAAAILQADDIADELDSDEIADLEADAKTLVKCVNLAIAETRVDFPVVHTAVVCAVGGFIPLDAFEGVISAVKKVERGGKPVSFTIDTRGIAVPSDGAYSIAYIIAPSDRNVDDEAEVGATLDCNILGYLAARNYCLITGRTDEAAIWDQRYNAEAECRRITRRAVLPKRRFL